jgi:RNA polymerase sigma-70 factor (ECF subfamily)
MLVENKLTNKPAVNALLALMCFQASRLDARLGKNGELILYDEQDTARWDTDLISRGGYFLNCAASGNEITKYHLEASIAYWHTQKKDTNEKWETVLQLYNQLLRLEYSPVAALNRVFVLSKTDGKHAAIEEAERLELKDYQFYCALLGELYTGIDNEKAKENFQKALSLAKTQTDKQAIQKKIDKF